MPSVPARTGQENQPELADLHLVPVGQHRGVPWLAVDVGAVEAAPIHHDEVSALAAELGVPARHRDVVEEDVAVRVTTSARGGPIEQKARTGVRATPDHQ